MKIRYNVAPAGGQVGDEREVPEGEGRYLVTIGAATEVAPKKKQPIDKEED